MKTNAKITMALAAVIGCAAVIGEPQVLREEYGGWLQRKAMDYDGRPLWRESTISGGLESPLDKHTLGYFMPWDELAPQPTGEDVWAHGETYTWWGEGDEKQLTAFEWSVTFSGNWTRKPIVFEGYGPEPRGVSFVWGHWKSPDLLTARLGGFHYSMANLGHQTQEVELEVDWETALGEPDQFTRHGMIVEPALIRSMVPKPVTDAYGVARSITINRTAK